MGRDKSVSSVMEWARQFRRVRSARRRFPFSVIHRKASVNADSSLGEWTKLFCGAVVFSSTIGDYTYIQENSRIYNAEIGPFCSIGPGVTVGLAAHVMTMVSTSPVFFDNDQPLPKFFTQTRKFTNTLPRTCIGADVWIGQGAMIKAGVDVGVGVVIGAGAVVTRDVPPYSITAGNPSCVIRQRFSDDICRNLVASQWWTLDGQHLEELCDLFVDPQALLAAINQLKGPDGSGFLSPGNRNGQ